MYFRGLKIGGNYVSARALNTHIAVPDCVGNEFLHGRSPQLRDSFKLLNRDASLKKGWTAVQIEAN